MPLNAAIQRIQRLWDSTGFSQMGRAGVHRPIYPILSATPRLGRPRRLAITFGPRESRLALGRRRCVGDTKHVDARRTLMSTSCHSTEQAAVQTASQQLRACVSLLLRGSSSKDSYLFTSRVRRAVSACNPSPSQGPAWETESPSADPPMNILVPFLAGVLRDRR